MHSSGGSEFHLWMEGSQTVAGGGFWEKRTDEGVGRLPFKRRKCVRTGESRLRSEINLGPEKKIEGSRHVKARELAHERFRSLRVHAETIALGAPKG